MYKVHSYTYIHNVEHSIHTLPLSFYTYRCMYSVQLSLSIQFDLFGLKACALWNLRNESLLIAQQNQKANANKTILTNERVCSVFTYSCVHGGTKSDHSNISWKIVRYTNTVRTDTLTFMYTYTYTQAYIHRHKHRHTYTPHIYTHP